MNKKLAKHINEMAKKDQGMRERVEKGKGWDYEIDKNNTEEMKKIIKKYGWPTIDKVGVKASKNAWLLVQHADHDLDFQKKVLKIMNDLIEENPKSIDKANIAYLTDRILVANKQKQEFGTQFYISNKKLKLRPTKDFKNLNKKRKIFNLDPIEKYLEDAKEYFSN